MLKLVSKSVLPEDEIFHYTRRKKKKGSKMFMKLVVLVAICALAAGRNVSKSDEKKDVSSTSTETVVS